MTLGGSVSYLGIGVKEILAERAKELKLKEEAGVEVTRVDSNSQGEFALHQNPLRLCALTPKGGQAERFLL